MRPLRPVSVLLLLLALSTAPAFAQQGAIAFEATEHDFGEVPEGTQAQHVFTFRNTGQAPLRLKDVRPSCGCTTPEWTQEPIAPGATGRISVAYNSAGRPGMFKKTIHVVTDGNPETVVLSIRGNVRPQALTDAYRQGNLRIDAAGADLGPVPSGENGHHAFTVQNAGERPIRFTKVAQAPEHVHVELPSRPLFSGDVARINVVVRTETLPAGQAFDYAVALETDDPEQPVKSIRVQGHVTDRGSH